MTFSILSSRSIWLILLFLVVLRSLPALAEPPRVLVSIAPLHSLVAQVMAGVGQPELLYQASQSPHSSAMTPSQLKAVTRAELLLWVGPELETALARLLPRLSENARAFDLHDYDASMLLLPMRDNLFTAVGAGHGHGHGHDHGDLDPHIWLSIANAQAFVDFVVARLEELDPQNAEIYQANADDTAAKLSRLAKTVEQRLNLSRNTPYIVFHDGFQYFDEEQGLNGLGALVLNPDIPPGPRTVSRLRDLAAPLERVCLFQEPQFSERWLSPLVAGLEQASLGVIDPLGSLSEPGPGLYSDMMLRLANDLAACLGEQ